jgi:transcription initiation factor TFIID subunit 12
MNAQQQPDPKRQLIRPDVFQKFSNYFPQETTMKYFQVITQSWAVLEKNPEGSEPYKQAFTNLSRLTQQISVAIKQRQAQAQAQQAQQTALSQQSQQQVANGGQGQASVQNTNVAGQQQAVDQKPIIKQEGQQAQQAQQAQRLALIQLPQQQLQMIETFPYVYPPSTPAGTPQGEKWLADTKVALTGLMKKMKHAEMVSKNFGEQITIAQGRGQPVDDLLKKQAEAKRQYDAFQASLKNWQSQQMALRAKQNATPGNAPAVKTEEAKAMGGMANNQTKAPMAGANMNQPSSATTPTSTRQPPPGTLTMPPSSIPATANMNNQQQQHQLHQQQRPNPAPLQTNVPQQSSEASGYPRQTPQSATTNQPVPYTHNDALTAARSHSEAMRSGAIPSGGQAHAQPAPRTTEHSASAAQRYPIQKTLSPSITDRPSPVAGPVQRPTLGAQGVMAQPVLPKTSGFVLEGDGTPHVLSKKKLDELVRQVTGGSDALTPEVEEVRFNISNVNLLDLRY